MWSVEFVNLKRIFLSWFLFKIGDLFSNEVFHKPYNCTQLCDLLQIVIRFVRNDKLELNDSSILFAFASTGFVQPYNRASVVASDML